MSLCLTKVEADADALSAEEKLQLISFLADRLRAPARERREDAQGASGGHSILDIPTVSVGGLLRPLGSREEWYDEMLEERV
jgi:hypothetical protein